MFYPTQWFVRVDKHIASKPAQSILPNVECRFFQPASKLLVLSLSFSGYSWLIPVVHASFRSYLGLGCSYMQFDLNPVCPTKQIQDSLCVKSLKDNWAEACSLQRILTELRQHKPKSFTLHTSWPPIALFFYFVFRTLKHVLHLR